MVNRIVELLQTEERYERQRLVRWVIFKTRLLLVMFTLLVTAITHFLGHLPHGWLEATLLVAASYVAGDLFFTMRDESRSKRAYREQVATLTARPLRSEEVRRLAGGAA